MNEPSVQVTRRCALRPRDIASVGWVTDEIVRVELVDGTVHHFEYDRMTAEARVYFEDAR